MFLKHAFAAAGLALACAAPALHAQQKYEMKLAYFVGDQHAMSQWLIRWSEQLEKGSGGRLVVKRFPNAQMGPTPQHYDFARTGQAEATWFLHGGTPTGVAPSAPTRSRTVGEATRSRRPLKSSRLRIAFFVVCGPPG